MNAAQPHGSPVPLDWMGYGAAAMSAGSWPELMLADEERPCCLPSPVNDNHPRFQLADRSPIL